ncbi:hypothetical protein [Pelagicoccus mobilis]|uniref:Uncharacterized protein n=1 Tax=Pelagicoccus mobilis TaxID=415221 RepID=A0A934RUL3_9BACT|nr:hypothetical protein [Pelagicoccus mobilis]MBK1875715.1 hypothetical protein [Pelagicoccus mobilis]
MPESNSAPDIPSEVTSLENLIVRYDMRKLRQEAKEQLENASDNRELLGQQAIANFFNLDDSDNARN